MSRVEIRVRKRQTSATPQSVCPRQPKTVHRISYGSYERLQNANSGEHFDTGFEVVTSGELREVAAHVSYDSPAKYWCRFALWYDLTIDDSFRAAKRNSGSSYRFRLFHVRFTGFFVRNVALKAMMKRSISRRPVAFRSDPCTTLSSFPEMSIIITRALPPPLRVRDAPPRPSEEYVSRTASIDSTLRPFVRRATGPGRSTVPRYTLYAHIRPRGGRFANIITRDRRPPPPPRV